MCSSIHSVCLYMCQNEEINEEQDINSDALLTLAAFLLHRERVKLVTSQATNQAYALCVLLRMRRRRGGGHNVTRPHNTAVTGLTGL